MLIDLSLQLLSQLVNPLGIFEGEMENSKVPDSWKFYESKQAKGSSKGGRDCRLAAVLLGTQAEMKYYKTFACKQGEPELPTLQCTRESTHKMHPYCCCQDHCWCVYLEDVILKE